MRTNIYIKSVAAISPLQAIEDISLVNIQREEVGNQSLCIEPNYKDYIPAIKARRMSRILKMTWVAANTALERAQIENPDMISVATGMGCQADTTKFLVDLIENKEEHPKPTAFINSTHNTPAGFLAIELKSKGQNFSFTHHDLNFEHALLDAAIRLNDKEVNNALIGAVDEITEETHLIKEKLGILRGAEQIKNELYTDKNNGVIDGEGAVFLVLENSNSATAMAKISALSFEYKIESNLHFSERIELFLSENQIKIDNIDFIIGGNTGDFIADSVLNSWSASSQIEKKYIKYKQHTGEFMSSGVYGLWLGALILQDQIVPDFLNAKAQFTDSILLEGNQNSLKAISNLLLINHNGQGNYSFILLQNND